MAVHNLEKSESPRFQVLDQSRKMVKVLDQSRKSVGSSSVTKEQWKGCKEVRDVPDQSEKLSRI